MDPTTSAASLPSPEATDPSDVSVALEAARALWENADTDEALRWFSRAAEAAEQAGNDRRALELARAVADLKDGLAANAGAVPAAPVAKSATPPPPPSARKSLPPAPPLVRLRPPPEAAPAKSAPPAPSMRPRPAEAAPAKSAPPPPSMRARPPEAAAGRSVSVSPPLPQAKPPSERPPAPAMVEKPEPSVASPAQRAKLPYEEVPTPAKVEKAAPTAKMATPDEESLRVSVKSSVRDPDLLLVRVLRRGQVVPSGCHEAFLSPAEHGVDLRSVRG
jgi:hypothetical protein